MRSVKYDTTESVAESWDEFVTYTINRVAAWRTELGEVFWFDAPHPGICGVGISICAKLPSQETIPVEIIYISLPFIDPQFHHLIQNHELRLQVFSTIVGDVQMAVTAETVSRPT